VAGKLNEQDAQELESMGNTVMVNGQYYAKGTPEYKAEMERLEANKPKGWVSPSVSGGESEEETADDTPYSVIKKDGRWRVGYHGVPLQYPESPCRAFNTEEDAQDEDDKLNAGEPEEDEEEENVVDQMNLNSQCS
jgi:hypothetical protein